MIRRYLNIPARAVRGTIYVAVLLPLIINIAYDYSKSGVTADYATRAVLLVIAVAAATEIVLLLRGRSAGIVLAQSQLQLYGTLERRFGVSVSELIQRSSGVDILCDTLKSFSDDEGRIKAINNRIDGGAKVRILVLNSQSGTTLKALCSARSVNKGVSYTEANIRSEILDSLKRFERVLGGSKVRGGSGVIRQYSHYPTCSIYRFDDFYMVCIYTFGRGGSSPAFVLRRSPLNEKFCDGLDQGFSELWNASTTAALP